jgi:hypothetical protein
MNTGVLTDPRLDLKVQNGFLVDEVLPASAVFEWKQKNTVKYPAWNQHRTSACVAFSKAKQISIKIFELTGVWIDFSPASIYQLRANKPAEGMDISNANDIVNKSGVTLEALMKSQGLTEEQIHQVRRTKVADLFAKAIAEAVVRYMYITKDITIDRIAQTIHNKGATSLLIYGTIKEYAQKVPTILIKDLEYADPRAVVRHEVVGVDYFLDKSNKKKLLINDSAHFGGLSEREFSEEFIAKRCILADVLDVFSFDPNTEKPKFDGSIISAQKCFKHEGFLSSDVIEVEIWGPQTKAACVLFQRKYGIMPAEGYFGTLTKAKLSSLYP